MAVEQIQNLPQQYVTDLGVDYGKQLAGLTSIPLDTARLAPQVAAQDALQTQAYNLAQSGVGSYQPFLTQAGAYSGPQGYQSFMSPYQQDIIDTTLAEFDTQAQKGLPSIAAQAVSKGVLGGGREGVMRAEYQTTSDRNRAALQAQLLGQGFAQAQQAAGQAFGQQQALAQQQQALAGQAPQLFGQQISALGALGTQQQAQTQAGLQAQQQLAYQQAFQPLQLAQQYGQGVTSLIAGYPASTQTQVAPSPSPLQTALGAGATLAGVYRAFS